VSFHHQVQQYREQMSAQSANNEQLQALSTTLQQEREAHKQLEAELAIVRPAVQELQTALRDQANSFQVRVSELEVQLNAQTRQRDELHRQLSEIEQTHKQEVQRLKSQISAQSDRAKSATQSSQATISQLEQRVADLSAANTSLQQRLAHSGSDFNKMRDRLNATQNAATNELRQALERERSLRVSTRVLIICECGDSVLSADLVSWVRHAGRD
jgi:chromosome segregation ATPase